MCLISYTTSSNNLAAEERQRRTTTTKYFTEKLSLKKVQTNKDKQVKTGACILEIRETSEIETENESWGVTPAEVERTPYLLTWWNKSPLFSLMTGNR